MKMKKEIKIETLKAGINAKFKALLMMLREGISWRSGCIIIALGLMFPSFIYGPMYLMLYLLNSTTLNEIEEIERDYAFLLFSMILIMSIVFLSSVFLLISAKREFAIANNIYIVLTVIQMLVTFLVAVGFLLKCTIFDEVCFDHHPKRPKNSNDRLTAILLFLGTMIYECVNSFFIFVACEFKPNAFPMLIGNSSSLRELTLNRMRRMDTYVPIHLYGYSLHNLTSANESRASET